MNTNASTYVRVLQASTRKFRCVTHAILILVLLPACATKQSAQSPILSTETVQESTAQSLSASSDLETSTVPVALPELLTLSKKPKEFAPELIGLMGASPGQCGAAANNTPQVKWTCAEYKNGLVAFMENWDKLMASAEVSLNYSYIATSDWMYFVVADEIDFFWKTYDMATTQVLVTYDPSETGNELIIGLNPYIGSQIATASGSYNLISSSQWLPVKNKSVKPHDFNLKLDPVH